MASSLVAAASGRSAPGRSCKQAGSFGLASSPYSVSYDSMAHGARDVWGQKQAAPLCASTLEGEITASAARGGLCVDKIALQRVAALWLAPRRSLVVVPSLRRASSSSSTTPRPELSPPTRVPIRQARSAGRSTVPKHSMTRTNVPLTTFEGTSEDGVVPFNIGELAALQHTARHCD